MSKQASTTIPAAIALVGSDLFLQLAALADLLKLLPKDAQTIQFEGETAELRDVLDEARCFALFGGAKVVVVRNADAFLTRYREQMEEYLSESSGGAMIVLRLNSFPSNQRIYKVIDKIGRIVRCEAPKDVVPWIVERGRTAHKLEVASDAARMLAELIGNDLGRLDNELAKLALVCGGGKAGAADVSGAVAFQREREMWDMTNSLASGETGAALRRWRQLVQLDNSAEYRAVTWLGMWLENVRKAQVMLARGESAFAIGQALKIWPRENAEKFARTAKALGREGLESALNLLAEIDFQTKTGVGDAGGNVERFILALAADKQAAGAA